MLTMARTFASVRGSHRSRREEGGKAHERMQAHVPVMLKEAIAALDLKKTDIAVDATYGQGGHSKEIQKRVKKLVTIDADPASGADIVGNFAEIKDLVPGPVDKVLFDLGWNMGQLGSGRGFSFLRDEPLDMRYGAEPRSGFTAAEVLNSWSEKAIADALFGYGEERYARRIAKAVAARRALAPFCTTLELVELVKDSVPAAYRRGKIHPATRTFQALRMAVNDELGAIEQGVRGAWEILAPGGRIAVITFHSVEDRAVKRLLRGLGGRLLFNPDAKGSGPRPGRRGKPFFVPSREEVAKNPAARSAKLRAIEKPHD